MSSNNELLSKFTELTKAPESVAQHFLSSNSWDLEEAVTQYYIHATSDDVDPALEEQQTSSRPPATGTQNKTSSQSKIKSFSDLRSDNEEDDNTDLNLFTGGEKSGLQVENPDKKKNPLGLVEDLIKKAEREASEPQKESNEPQPKKNKFTGTGYKLGSVDKKLDSQVYEDPRARNAAFQPPEKATRTITFWKEGFQVGDGKLYRYDDPENAEFLRQLNAGRAPLSLLDVQMFQDVEVNVIKKMDESFKPPKAKKGGFVGKGQRLGSPVPGEQIGEQTAEPETATSEPTEPTEPSEAATAAVEEQGDAKIQIRMADGSRLVHSFNSTDPVSSVFEFVAGNTSAARDWVLAFAFPLQVIEDDGKSIKEAGLINSVVIQRWK